MTGEGRAADAVAALIEGDQHGFFRDSRENGGGFLGDAGRGVPRAAFRNFMNFETAKAELAPHLVEPLAVAPGQLPLRALLEAADCYHDETHKHFPARWNP